MTGAALRSSALAALVLVVAGCATRGDGRGGILHSPIAIDSTDPLYSEYLEHVRQRIKEKWGYPCVRAGQLCEYKSTSLEANFGILKDGRLQYVEIVRSADFPIYDDYVLRAIKLASPFRPVPPALMAATHPGSTGIPIRTFRLRGERPRSTLPLKGPVTDRRLATVFGVASLTGLRFLQSSTESAASWERRLCGGACALLW